MYRRFKKPCSLLQICLSYVSRNLEGFKHESLSEIIECLPPHLKNALLEKRTRLAGFKDDDQLKTLLNRHTLKLTLSSSTITDQTLENITLQCPDLRHLKLTEGSYQFTTDGLLATFPKLRALQEIYIQNSDQMTDDVVQCIGENCKILTVLDVGRSNLTDKCIDYIADLKLTHLNLSYSKITDAALAKLATSECGRHLMDLNISFCSVVTSKGLAQLNWERIQYIGFEGCEIVGKKSWSSRRTCCFYSLFTLSDLDFVGNGKQLKYIQWTIN